MTGSAAASSREAALRASTNVAEQLLAVGGAADPALLIGADTVTYAQLRERVDEAVTQLVSRGLAPGSRVGLVAENGLFFVVAYLATIRSGLCVVPLPLTLPAERLGRIMADTDMQLLLVTARIAPDDDVSASATATGTELWSEEELRLDTGGSLATAPSASASEEADSALAALFFTSGSTGVPKGVMITHRNISANASDIVEYMGLAPTDRAMLVLPLHYCYGLSVLHAHLLAGASVVINNGFMFPEKVLDDMEAKGCSGLAGVPSTYQILLRRSHFRERQLPALRWLQQAGGSLPEPFIREVRDAFPEVRFYVMYGQTEATARLSYLPPERLGDKIGSIGRGLPSTVLEVLKDDGSPVRPGSDEVGEIVATGDNISPGYWNDASGTQTYFGGGKLRTRDLARVDRDGFIFIVDRARDFIKSMGIRISPRDIEEVIAALAEVVEVAVIGVPDEIWGEAVKAVVVPVGHGELSDKTIVRHCHQHLPNHMVPTVVELAEHLPKNAAGKVLKSQLREAAQNRESRS